MRKRVVLLSVWLWILIFTIQAGNHPYYHFKQLSIDKGLPSSITALFDDDRSLWIGTPQGVYRFDGEDINRYPLPKQLRNSSHYINEIVGDNQNRIWILTYKGISYHEHNNDSLQVLLRNGAPIKGSTIYADGEEIVIPIIDTLLIYNKQLELIRMIPFSHKKMTISSMMSYDNRHYLINNQYGQLSLMEKQTGKLSPSPFDKISKVYCFFLDSSNCFWISNYDEGVSCFSHDGKLLDTFNTLNSKLNNNLVLDIKEWGNTIWLATDGGGINIIHKDTHDIQILSNQNTQHFPANSIACLCPNDRHMWIGMVREGVLSIQRSFITTYSKASLNQYSGLSEKCILFLWEDTDGSIWVATDGGGINRFDPGTEQFTHYPETMGEKIVSICPFSDTELLLSSFSKGFFRFNKKTGSYRRLHLPDKEIEDILTKLSTPANLRVNDQGEIEIYGPRSYRYSPKENKIVLIRPNIKGLYASWIYFGKYNSDLFFHDYRNIFLYNCQKEEFKIISYREHNQVLAASIDPSGVLWISKPNGIKSLSLSTGKEEYINLPDDNDVITSIVIDSDGTVWMGALGVLYAYTPETKHFAIYNSMDGVLPNDFLSKPVLVAKNGNIYMGGTEGLLRINKQLKVNMTSLSTTLYLRKILLNGTLVSPTQQNELEIADNFSSMEIFVHSEGSDVFHKRIYRFHIKGLNNGIIEIPHPRLMLHTLSAGTYQITVQCTQNDGSWGKEFNLLSLYVYPPWWKRTWFISLCIGVIILWIIYLFIQQEKRLQRKLHEQEREVYKDKVRALINISHELRTPLTLIYTPLKQLTNSKQIPYEYRMKLQKILKQASQMANLIDMILNLRKMEVEQNILRMSSVNFNEWLLGILDEFRDEFQIRNITLAFKPDPEIQTMCFDCNQCKIIINNLLMNASKFSESNSTITVSTKLESYNGHVRITIKDEGIGLREDDIKYLFNRFYQGKHSLQGSGIGLSYAKQLVEMHGGIIGARNNEDKGATFFFTLPYRQDIATIISTPQNQLNHIMPDELERNKKQLAQEVTDKFHSILIVEDDRDLCDFLVCNLQASFENVYEAHDGIEAIPILCSQIPQIILCDIKMPRMNGLELCQYIHQKKELNHIPVILLTSCVDNEIQEEGYRAGAEAYITKPFDMELIIIQLKNILHNHAIIKKRYSNIEFPKQAQETLAPINEQLWLQFNQIINDNISNIDMDVHFISTQMGMSRASLYSKTKEMMGMGINEYIIKCRLGHACHLLKTTLLSISEISEQSGFKHSRNFSTLFKNTIGQSPSEYRKNQKKQ